MIAFAGPVKTVNVIGDGYIETVKIWRKSLDILMSGDKPEPYRLIFTPLGEDMDAILSVAGIFVRGEVDSVDEFLDELLKSEKAFVSEVTVH